MSYPKICVTDSKISDAVTVTPFLNGTVNAGAANTRDAFKEGWRSVSPQRMGACIVLPIPRASLYEGSGSFERRRPPVEDVVFGEVLPRVLLHLLLCPSREPESHMSVLISPA